MSSTPDEDSSEEIIIEGGDSDGAPFSEPSPSASELDVPYAPILPDLASLACAVLPEIQFVLLTPFRLEITIPSRVLPEAILIVNRLDASPTLLEFTLELKANSFQNPPAYLDLRHPVFGPNFPGRPLLSLAFARFFSTSYAPKPRYRSALYLLYPERPHPPDARALRELAQLGYGEDAATRALSLTRGNVAAARDLLLTGITDAVPPPPVLSYADCPILYLVLEIVDAFLDLTDHCCICGAALGVSGLRISNCGKELCVFGMASMGIGSSLAGELRRDPMVADLLVSLASSCFQTKFFVPPLPARLVPHAAQFFARLPPIAALMRFDSDAELEARIGKPFFEILRFIVFTNRCHLIYLPKQLGIQECIGSTEQFLCLVATPERELAFQRKKVAGSAWLWHGSLLVRWHSILRTGLQDLGTTPDATHGGPWDGNGVYETDESAVAFYYATEDETDGDIGENAYVNTKLPKQMTVLALVENVPGPALKQVQPNEYTQQDPEALLVRCLMVVTAEFQWNVYQKPPKEVPTLKKCLSFIASKH
jgi:poly [ADP-ribose] polymerase 6/8